MFLNSQILYIGDYVCIISVICNKFRFDVSVVVESDLFIVVKMCFFLKEVNVFKEYVERNGNLLKLFDIKLLYQGYFVQIVIIFEEYFFFVIFDMNL